MKKIIFSLLLLVLPFCGGKTSPPFLLPHPDTPLWSLVEKKPEDVLTKEARSPEDIVARGFAYYRLGASEQAFQEFKRAEEEGERVYSLLGMGMVKEAEGNLLEAYFYYKDCPHPLARERERRIKQGALQQALSSQDPKQIAKGLLIDPYDKRVYLALGNYYLRQGKPFLARVYLERGLKTVGDDEALLRLLEFSYEQEGDLENALEVARRLYEISPTEENLKNFKEIQERLEERRIREKIRDLEGKPVITRGDLAIMIDAFLGKFLVGGKPPIIVDLYRSRQMPSILKITSTGIMKVYPNHTFQPDAEVRRISLAKILYRLVKKLGLSLQVKPVILRDTQSRYALFAVGAGLMKAENGVFMPYKTVNFKEVALALSRIRKFLRGRSR